MDVKLGSSAGCCWLVRLVRENSRLYPCGCCTFWLRAASLSATEGLIVSDWHRVVRVRMELLLLVRDVVQALEVAELWYCCCRANSTWRPSDCLSAQLGDFILSVPVLRWADMRLGTSDAGTLSHDEVREILQAQTEL